MAVVQVSYADSKESYTRVSALVHQVPQTPGRLLHAASELPDGRVQIVDVFESAQALEKFGAERVLPAFAQLGMLDEQLTRPRPEGYEAFELYAASTS